MELTPVEIAKYLPKSRPYPFDLERKQKVERVMNKAGIKTVKELAGRLNYHYTTLNEVINGTRLSVKTEERIARFFGMRREELFPQRTMPELAAMNKKQLITTN